MMEMSRHTKSSKLKAMFPEPEGSIKQYICLVTQYCMNVNQMSTLTLIGLNLTVVDNSNNVLPRVQTFGYYLARTHKQFTVQIINELLIIIILLCTKFDC